MMRAPRSSFLLGLPVGVALGSGCTDLLSDHCANMGGDASCVNGGFCSKCTVEADGCMDVRPTGECYFPGTNEGSSSGGSTSSSDTTDGSSTAEMLDSTTSGGPQPCTMDEECTNAAAPFCEPASGGCVSCDGMQDPDAACATLDPMTPLCVDGVCVQCSEANPGVCDDQLLLCDPATNACVPCTEHAQCESGACELAIGTCFPADVVVHVDGDGGQDFTSVTDAVNDIPDGMQGVIIVHELDRGGSYPGGVTIDGAKRIALLAAPGEAPALAGMLSSPGLLIEEAATIVYVDGVRLAGNLMGIGLGVDGAFAWLDRSHIVLNSGGGVAALNAAELVLRNCFVGGNGTGVIGAHGIEVFDADLHILYSTVARNDEATVDSIQCTAGTVDVRNSIVVGRDANSIDCPGIEIANSALDENIGGNTNVGPANSNWFTNVVSGDFHLTTGGALNGATVFADIAQWALGDPTVDIDGDPRPTTDGTPDYAGADIP